MGGVANCNFALTALGMTRSVRFFQFQVVGKPLMFLKTVGV